MRNRKSISNKKRSIFDNVNVKVLFYTSALIYSSYPYYAFPFYMFIIYCQTRCKSKPFNVKPIPDKLISNLIEKIAPGAYYDVNNVLITNEKYKDFLCINKYVNMVVKTNNKQQIRLANVYGAKIDKNLVLLSETLYYNMGYIENKNALTLKPTFNCFKTVAEVNLSLVNTQFDIVNAVTDVLLKNYFQSPKVLYKNDIIVIPMRVYGEEFFFSNHKMNEIETIYFKCNRIKDSDGNDILGGVCLYEETTLRQSANIQSFLPKFTSTFVSKKFDNVANFGVCVEERCPKGLTGYLQELELSLNPFLTENLLKIKPCFMIRGARGCGKNILLQSLAFKLGLNLFKVTSNDFSALAYAQMEVKLKNVLFKARLCAPCILAINNFENFGKNNEGQYDQRIITFFKEELDSFFDYKSHPVILFCVSNAKEVPSDLGRIFLEVFDVNSPSQKERFEILNWIISTKNLSSNFDLNEVASKSHGFLYEDLEALVFYAERNWFRQFGNGNLDIVLRLEDFTIALDIMQNSYTDSLGAPKVPKVEWSDVGGLNDVKLEIIRTINLPLQHPELLKSTGLKRSGILLYGPPGTGKTLLAKAVATECGLCFLSVKGPELLNMYVGQSEQNVREVFEKARQAAPCIIFFDELDSLAPNRGVSGDSGGVMDRVVSQLLAEMDGLNQSATLFIIGATNRPDLIDPALLRPGRFDKLLYVGPCTDDQSKLSVLKALTRKFMLSDDVKLDQIVKNCPKNITGADFYGLCSNAWTSAARKLIERIEKGTIKNKDELTEKNVVVTTKDFQEAIRVIKPSISAEDLQYFEKLKLELSAKK